MRFIILTSLIIMPLTFAACGGDGEEAYDTYQACFDDHKNVEMASTNDSIVICCLDHPIAGVTEVCGATEATCIAYLDANLLGTSATATEKMAACTDYVTQKGM